MTYIPSKSFRKAIASVRIQHLGGGSANLILDNGAPSSITFSLSAWTQIFASTADTVKALSIFDGTGEIGFVAIGAASSEVVQFRIIPGGNGDSPFQIDAANRIALRYETALPAVNSETVINFYK
jgi:hypothetical protein